MTIFEKVKAGISAREAAERYGLELDRYGKSLCPFHNDRHPSLYVDDDHYHCFACGEHGDVIDLVAKLFDLSLRDAANKLAYDFGLTQDKPPTREMQEKLNKKSKAQQLREAEELCFAALMADRKLLQMQLQQHRPKIPDEPPDDVYAEACRQIDHIEYMLELLAMGDSNERTELMERLMEDDRSKKLQEYMNKVKKEIRIDK